MLALSNGKSKGDSIQLLNRIESIFFIEIYRKHRKVWLDDTVVQDIYEPCAEVCRRWKLITNEEQIN